jgi:hypothetical protein
MAECAIEIADSEEDHRPGETIRGEVVVRVTGPTDCRALTVATLYRIEGHVNTFESEPRTRRLFAGQWLAGEHRYPFELPVPPGPATYRGASLQVMHWLVARADLAWTTDAVAERRVAVAPEDVRGYDDGPGWPSPFPDRPAPDHLDAAPRGCIVPAGLTFISCIGILFLIIAHSAGKWAATPIALPFVFVPIFLAFRLYGARLAARGLGRPDGHLDRTTVRAGESTRVRVRYRPPRRLALRRAMVDLECTETTLVGSGKGARLNRQTVYREEFPLDVPHEVAAGETIDRVLDIPIPRDAPPTFLAPGAALVWRVGVHFAAGRGRHVTHLLPLTVRPPSGRAAVGSSA